MGMRRLVPMSQRQHVMLYPNTSTGGEMVLPFIFPYEFVPIDAELTAKTMEDLGTITIQSVGSLGFLGSNAPENVDITMLMSLEPDYELAGPTTFELQSGEPNVADLRHVTSSAVPSMSGWRSVVEKLGPAVARIMGFSNPPLLNNVDTVRIQNVPNLANTQLSSRDEVLAAHPGTTLNATNDTIGGDESDMLISNLVKKDSILSQCYWKAVGAGSEVNAVLFEALVHPQLSPVVERVGTFSGAYDQVVPVPMDWVSQPFKLWRGDITFSFEIVTTKFQRGRLRVSYDPSGDFSDSNTFGRVYTKVLDISEETKFDFTVPYMAPSAWLSTLSTQFDPSFHGVNDTKQQVLPSGLDSTNESLYPYNPQCMNGKLRLTYLIP
jgi:hypothetical protein